MDNSYFTNPLEFLVSVLFGLYALIVMLRFLLQLMRADFYNPLSQFIVKVTTPLLNPLRRVIPGVGGIDISSLVLAWFVMALEQLLLLAIRGGGFMPLDASLMALPALLQLTINIFLFSVLIRVLLSWISPGNYNPAIGVINSLTEPLMAPARRLIKPIGGMDLSPIAVMIGLSLLDMLLTPLLVGLVRTLL